MAKDISKTRMVGDKRRKPRKFDSQQDSAAKTTGPVEQSPTAADLQHRLGNRALQLLISRPGENRAASKGHYRGSGIIQRWKGGIHKQLSRTGITDVFKENPSVQADPNQINALADKSNDMDYRFKEIVFNAGALLGPSWLNPIGRIFSNRHDLLTGHYLANPDRAKNHGEGGMYYFPKAVGAVINARHQLSLENEARALYYGGKNNPDVRDQVFTKLGDALHVAQDRGSHGEGGIGQGHDNTSIKCDDPGENTGGLEEARANTAQIIRNAMDYLSVLLAANPAPASTPTEARTPNPLMRSIASVFQRDGEGPVQLDEETTGRINQARGSGQSLDSSVQERASRALRHDFSSVVVHTSPEADALNRQLNARAFTTGQDIFFREGEYQPNTSSGQELITHELAHVVQQSSGAVQGQGGPMTVNPPGDRFELEADAAARQAAQSETAAQVQRQALPEEEEEKSPQMNSLQRDEDAEAPEEEEEVPVAQKQEMEDEEEGKV